MAAENVTLLTALDGAWLAKRISRLPDGTVKIWPYDYAKWFRIGQVQVDDIYEFHSHLWDLAPMRDMAMVRGEPIDGINRQRSRKLSLSRTQNGVPVPATLAAAPRYVVPTDFDSLPCPPWLNAVDEPDVAVEFAVSHLPDEFHGATVAYEFTAGQGIKPGLNLRLYHWSDRPLSDAELKALFKGCPVDPKIYAPAQPIYTATLVVEADVVDPVPARRRIGLWRGDRDEITLPPIETAKARQAAGGISGAPSQSYAQHRADIGDHEGGRGFHGPIGSAIYRYFYEHGAETDAEWLRADLEAATRSAHRDRAKHPDAYIEDRVRDLDAWIEWTREQEQEKADAQSRPIEPSYPPPMGSADEARGAVAAAVRAWAAEAEAWREGEPPTIRGILAGVGLSKTTAACVEAIVPRARKKLPTIMACPTTKLCEEVARQLATLGVEARVYYGRSADDPTNPAEQMCRKSSLAAAIIDAGASVKRHACRSDGHECELAHLCGDQRQQRKPPLTWLVPHALLFLKRPECIPAGAALILDEAFHGSAMDDTWLDLAELLVNRRAFGRTREGADDATADLRAISYRVYDAITAGADGFLRLDALIAAGVTADDIRLGLNLEKHRLAILNGVVPGMPQAEALRLIKIAGKHNRRVLDLMKLWELLGRQFETQAARSPWLTYHAAVHPKDDPKPSLRMSWCNPIHKSWAGPALLLDATMAPKIARVFFPAMPDPARIEAAMPPHVRIRQITDRPMSRHMLIESEDADEAHNKTRRNNLKRLRDYIETRAAEVAPKRALVVCQLDVEEALKAGWSPPSNVAMPANVELAHHGAVRGLNQWGDVALLIVVGRTEPNARTVERIARALFGVDIEEIPAAANGDAPYRRITKGIRMRDGSGRAVEANRHPDPLVEAVRWSIAEAGLIHAVGRPRGVNRTADTPLQIDILTNICLPGIEVDEVTTWDAIQPSEQDIMRSRGAVPSTHADQFACYPDLFKNAKAAEDAARRDRRNPPKTPIEESYIGKFGGFLSVAYRKRGSRGPAGRLLFDPARIDPAAWLAAKLGVEVTLLDTPRPIEDTAAPEPEVEPRQPIEDTAAPEPEPEAPAARDDVVTVVPFWRDPTRPRSAPVGGVPPWRQQKSEPPAPATRPCEWFVEARHCGAPVAHGMTWCPAHIAHAAAITGYGEGRSIPFFGDDDVDPVAEAAD